MIPSRYSISQRSVYNLSLTKSNKTAHLLFYTLYKQVMIIFSLLHFSISLVSHLQTRVYTNGPGTVLPQTGRNKIRPNLFCSLSPTVPSRAALPGQVGVGTARIGWWVLQFLTLLLAAHYPSGVTQVGGAGVSIPVIIKRVVDTFTVPTPAAKSGNFSFSDAIRRKKSDTLLTQAVYDIICSLFIYPLSYYLISQ